MGKSLEGRIIDVGKNRIDLHSFDYQLSGNSNVCPVLFQSNDGDLYPILVLESYANQLERVAIGKRAKVEIGKHKQVPGHYALLDNIQLLEDETPTT